MIATKEVHWHFESVVTWMPYGTYSSVLPIQLLLQAQPLSPGFCVCVLYLHRQLGWLDFSPRCLGLLLFPLDTEKSKSFAFWSYAWPGITSQPHSSEKWKRERTYFHIHMCLWSYQLLLPKPLRTIFSLSASHCSIRFPDPSS